MKVTLKQLAGFSQDVRAMREALDRNQDNIASGDWGKLHWPLRRMEKLAEEFEGVTVSIKP